MILFEKFGYTIETLENKDSNEMFNVLEPEMVDFSKHNTMVARDKRILSVELRTVLSDDRYTNIGLKKDGKLIGVSISNEKDGGPWLGHLAILKEYRKTKASIVLIHYIMNILYKDKTVMMGNDKLKTYHKFVRVMPKILDFVIMKPEVSKRFANIIDKG